MKQNVAIIGSGVAGITVAYLLQNNYAVTLYEKNDYIGGHTHTVVIENGLDADIPVDTGFIVCNNKTYPNFLKLLSKLQVDITKTNMSFSYYDQQADIQFSSHNINSLFAQRKNIFKLQYWKFISDLIKFGNKTKKKYYNHELQGLTLGEYLKKENFSLQIVNQFVIPMAAAIWSASDATMMKFPMESFARFYINHGLLNILDHPQWYFVKNGSHSYVRAFLRQFSGTVVKKCTVKSIKRTKKEIILKTEDGKKFKHDKVIIATHADEALNMLKSPTADEKRLLSAWEYSRNETILHTDESLLPPLKRAWSSWNYIRNNNSKTQPITVTYYMNQLQKLKASKHYCVTLNPSQPIDRRLIIKEMLYTHPIYSFDSLATQFELPSLNGVNNTYFCGSYFGYGFHEDAVKSALQVARKFGEKL